MSKTAANQLKIEAALGRRFEASEKKVCRGLLGRPGGLCGLRGEDFRRGKPRPHTAGQSKVWNYMSGAWSRKDWQGPGRGLGTPCPCKQGAADRSAHSAGPSNLNGQVNEFNNENNSLKKELMHESSQYSMH